jgi:hypothetical protein
MPATTAKLIAGFIFKEESALSRAKIILQRKFGKIDFISPVLAFCYTDYYEKEFGKDLKRQFVSFRRLIDPSQLYRIKLNTNKIERELSRRARRLVNIDPGYLDLAKLVLASTKDYNHRIYLKKGIYAEVTLFYRDKAFRSWEWTYPDYKSPEYLAIFQKIRENYALELKNRAPRAKA